MRERRKCYESLDMKNFLGNKEFWETIRPFLSDKNTVFSQISIEKNRIISDDFDLSEECSSFFLKMLLGCSMSSQMNII